MKKFLAYVLMILFYFTSNTICNLLNAFYYGSIGIMILSLALTVISSAILGYLSFRIPEKITCSEHGLRYKVFSILTLIIGVTTSISALSEAYPGIEMYQIFNNLDALAFFLVSLINPMFIFGITLFVFYKRNYKKRKMY